jgi:hypothetical protein
VDGKIIEIRIKNVKGIRPLSGKKLKDFEDFLEAYGYVVIKKWVEYLVYNKKVDFEKINVKDK